MRNITVLVTGVGATTGISVIKGLRQQDEFSVRVVGTDINPKKMIAGSHFCDGFYTVPLAVNKSYIPTLLDICEKEEVDLLIPIIDIELQLIAENVETFRSRGIRVLISDLETIRICNDKYLTHKFFKESGIPTPATLLPTEVDDFSKLDYPVFVKPRDGVSSINTFKVEGEDDLKLYMQRVPNLLIQEYLEGKEYTTDVLTDIEDGRVITVVPRERLQTKAGISYKGRTCKDERLIAYGEKIAEKAGIRGPANIQCKIQGDEIKYFEINPRFSGGLPLTIAAGVNNPFLVLKMAKGEKIPDMISEFKDNLIMTRYWEEIFYEG